MLLNEELACKVLERMRGPGKGVPGNFHYNFLTYQFYDFEELLGLSSNEYEKIILYLASKNWIKIDFNGSQKYERAKIVETVEGACFLESHRKPEVI